MTSYIFTFALTAGITFYTFLNYLLCLQAWAHHYYKNCAFYNHINHFLNTIFGVSSSISFLRVTISVDRARNSDKWADSSVVQTLFGLLPKALSITGNCESKEFRCLANQEDFTPSQLIREAIVPNTLFIMFIMICCVVGMCRSQISGNSKLLFIVVLYNVWIFAHPLHSIVIDTYLKNTLCDMVTVVNRAMEKFGRCNLNTQTNRATAPNGSWRRIYSQADTGITGLDNHHFATIDECSESLVKSDFEWYKYFATGPYLNKMVDLLLVIGIFYGVKKGVSHLRMKGGSTAGNTPRRQRDNHTNNTNSVMAEYP